MFRRNTPIKNKYFCLKCKDQSWIVECGDGCGAVLPRYDRVYRLRLFLKNHDKIGKTPKNIKKGYEHPLWKFGRSFSNNYWTLLLPDYYLSNKNGRVLEHVYFYQEKNKLCMLKWGVVHHIDGNTENNMPWNLEGMMRSKHISHHHKGKIVIRTDKSDRFCKFCGGKTYIRNGSEHWFGNKKDGWVCETCYQRVKKGYKKRRPLEKVIL